MNNRQAGRRRGRGGQRQGGNPGRPDNGNRIDNRARGNAAQLLEKYKNLAADAQRAGDRVNTEYYLQFADHYFRVLAETRSRAEDNGQARRPRDEDMDDEGEDFGFEGEVASPAQYQQSSDDGERQDRQERPRRDQREDRSPRGDREARPRRDRDRDREGGYDQGEDRPRRQPREMTGQRDATGPRDTGEARPEERAAPIPANDEPRRTRRPRRETVQAEEAQDNGFDAALLPPAISTDVAPVSEDAPAERPRRGRPRRVRTEDEAIPPAA
ncbi:DUF4167 domain-containing protein [Sphingomonas floccifaciens]|uniref:DUF4167 domain-containing protein n=1 Tax=Sphingomonas floccifaciens TaxID=1844115 RepID=A0ABW4NIT5_9SPHN